MVMEMNHPEDRKLTDQKNDNFLLSICFLLNIDMEIKGLVMFSTLTPMPGIFLNVRFYRLD